MKSTLDLRFALQIDGAPVRTETTAYDAGDSNLTLISVEPRRGLLLRSAFDYEEGRATLTVMDSWRERGNFVGPEVRVLRPISLSTEALRRSCLYDHIGRLIEVSNVSGQPLVVRAIDRALSELNPISRRGPAN